MAGGKKRGRDGKRKGGESAPAGYDDEPMEILGNEQDWVPEAASKNVEEIPDAPEDEFGAKDFRKEMELRPDHGSRPLWVAPNGHIFLEVNSSTNTSLISSIMFSRPSVQFTDTLMTS